MSGHSIPAVVLGAVLSFFLAQPVRAGGWTLDQGQWQASLDVIHTHFDRVKRFDDSTGKPGDVNFVSTDLSIEFGLFDQLTLFASVPYETSNRDGTSTTPSFDRRKSETGLGDGRFGLRVRCLDEFDDDPLTFSISGAVKAPLSNYDEHKLHSFGDGQVDLELRLGVGRVFTLVGFDHFVSLDAGYRWRVGDPGDEVFGFLEVGTFVTSDLAVRLFADVTDSRSGLGLESPSFVAEATASGQPPFPKVEEDVIRLGGGLSYDVVDGASVNIFYARTVFADNTSVDRVFGVGVTLER